MEESSTNQKNFLKINTYKTSKEISFRTQLLIMPEAQGSVLQKLGSVYIAIPKNIQRFGSRKRRSRKRSYAKYTKRKYTKRKYTKSKRTKRKHKLRRRYSGSR